MNHNNDRQEARDPMSAIDNAPHTREPSTAHGPVPKRRKGERRKSISLDDLASLGSDDVQRLLQDLNVHQIELEMQNEELRRTQEALELSRTRYFDLYDLAPVGYITITEQGLIREANLAAATLLGLSRDALTMRPLTGFILPADHEIFLRCRQNVFATGNWQACDLHLRKPGGMPFPAHLDFALAKERDGVSTPCLVTLSDLSERQRAEATRLAEAAQREENQRKDHFLAMLGHELRNPLAPIRHVAEILRLAPTQDATRLNQIADILNRQVGHLSRLVDDLLDVSHLCRGKIRLALEPCDLREIVEHAAEQIRPLLEERRQRLALTLPVLPLPLNGEPVRLTQIVVNLLRNACQFSAAEAVVSLSLKTADGRAVLQVCDTGAGIEPSLLSRIFDPFMQSEQTGERSRGGLGLGLSLVKGLVELHGGSVEATSPGLGQGSTFTLRLPLSRLPVARPSSDRETCATAMHRILIVEDQPDVAQSCALLLRLLGQEVEVAPDGPTALAAIERLRPNLILLDLGLPGMDGYEVARRLRATEPGRTAWLAAVTGYGQPQDVERTRATGFDEHLLKPLGQNELVALLARCPAPPFGD